jgi:hypothetical protein
METVISGAHQTWHPSTGKKYDLYVHTEKIRNTDRGCRLWEVKNSGYKNSSSTEVKRTFIHQNLSIFITKSLRNFCQTKKLSTKPAHLHLSFGTFYIKFMFSSFSTCCNHFTSLAYEIFYARKVDLFDKINPSLRSVN